MKKVLHIFVGALCLAAPTVLPAQHNSIPVNVVGLPAHQHTGAPVILPASANFTRAANPGGNSPQSTTCTDKVTYVDRHSQANQDIYLGGVNGWEILLQVFPSYTGQVTEAYGTLKKYTGNAHVRFGIYALDANNQPTGGYLSYVDATVTSTSYGEFGGVLNAPANVTNGFAIGVFINTSYASDSAALADHNDPDSQDFSFLIYNSSMYSSNTDFGVPSDFLLRPKISFPAPTSVPNTSTPTACAGVQISFDDNSSTGYPDHYLSSAFVYNNPLTTVGYNWNFGDAGTSTAASPVTHAYSTAGTYTVTLSETYNGWTNTCPSNPGTTSVTINGTTPTVSIAATSTLVCTSDNVTFQATPTNGGSGPTYVWKKNGFQVGTGVSWSGSGWTSGDQVTCEMTSNASCAPTSPVVSNVITIYQQPGSLSSFNYTRNGLVVSFTSTSQNASTYTWDFGDATSPSNSPNPVHTYASAGTYAVQLTTTNVCGTQNISFLNITVSSTGSSSGGNTGVKDQDFKIDATAFPNPANSQLNLVYSVKNNADLTFEMMNSLGQVISSQRVEHASSGTLTFPMEDIAPGVYFIRIKDDAQHATVLHVVHM